MVLSKVRLLFLLFMGAVSIDAASLYESLSLKDKVTWQRLLHFHKGSSRIDTPSFFVSSIGPQDAEAELQKFVSLYQSSSAQKYGRLELGLACAYPARIQFLERVGLIKKRQHRCPEFKNWQKEVNPKALSVVFSTAYPNNPGSMFGHTFLRFHNFEGVNDLLDYGANYAALTNEADIGVVYAFKGIFGGYRGFFDLSPYYVKVNEYNHGENRDLIEYQLNLKPEQVTFLLAHLWELYQGASFDYFFTYENCSFHLSDFINVVLDEPLYVPSRWYYLPADLIHALKDQPGLIKEVRQRPSQMRKVKKLMAQLNSSEEAAVKVAFQEETDQGLSLKERRVLATMLDLEKFKEKEKFKRSPFLSQNLKEMAKSGVRVKKLTFDLFENRPDEAHRAQKLSLGMGKQKEGTMVASYQSGYHDLLARDKGLERFSQFRFLGVRGNYSWDSEKARLEEFNFIDVVSLHPWSWYHSQLSWRVGVWVEDTIEDLDCRSCYRAVASGKMGVSFGENLWIASFLVGLREEVTESIDHLLSYEALLGASVGPLKGLISFEGRHNSDNIKDQITNVLGIGLNYSWQVNWEARLLWQSAYVGRSFDLAGERGSFNLGYYF